MTTATPPPAEKSRAYIALMSIATRIQQVADQALRERVGITHAQTEILAVLHRTPAGLRMSELADRLLLSRSGLTYQVSQMEKRSLLQRRRGDGDDRSVLVTITPSGEELFEAALPDHMALVDRLLYDGMTSAEIVALADALESISGRLTDTLAATETTTRRTHAAAPPGTATEPPGTPATDAAAPAAPPTTTSGRKP